MNPELMYHLADKLFERARTERQGSYNVWLYVKSAEALRDAAYQFDRPRSNDWHADYQEAAADRDSILEAFGTDNSADVIAVAGRLAQAGETA